MNLIRTGVAVSTRGKTTSNASASVFLPAVAVAVAGCFLHIFMGHSWVDTAGHAWGSDDAFISFRYALNAAEGHGLVFNPGERVEGYSNLLYVAVLTLVALAGSGSALYPAALVINTAALVGLILLLGFWLRRSAGPVAAIAGTLGVALFPPLWAAVASGLETPVVLLLQTIIVIGTLSLARDPDGSAIRAVITAAILSILIRPDGFIIPIFAAMVIFACGGRRPALRLLAAIVIGVAALTAWRLTYYGLPLPMTYYAKVTGSIDQRLLAGARQLLREALPTGMLPHLLVLAILTPFLALDLVRRIPGRNASISQPGTYAILAFFGCGWLAYWLYIGGDVFSERFLLIIAIISWTAIGLAMRDRRPVLVLAAVPLGLQLSPLVYDGRFDYRTKEYDMWAELGTFLGNTHPGATLAIDAAGKVPFYSHLPTIDMLGLNDAHIGMMKTAFTAVGHSKIDPDYVMSRHPDLISAWLTPQMEMGWGIGTARYLSEGYCLRYLVQSDRPKPAAPIIDFWKTDVPLTALYAAGYRYGVIEHVGPAGCPMVALPADSTIDFSTAGDAAIYKTSGWSVTKSWGTWSEGGEATLRLPFPSTPDGDIELQATAHGFTPLPDKTQDVEVVVNGTPVARWSFAPGVGDVTQRALIPAEVAALRSPATITFRVEHPISPADAGMSGDTRQLGFGLVQLRVTRTGRTGSRVLKD